jgi:hypothetical protein
MLAMLLGAVPDKVAVAVAATAGFVPPVSHSCTSEAEIGLWPPCTVPEMLTTA